jgi:hypothetical protein
MYPVDGWYYGTEQSLCRIGSTSVSGHPRASENRMLLIDHDSYIHGNNNFSH